MDFQEAQENILVGPILKHNFCTKSESMTPMNIQLSFIARVGDAVGCPFAFLLADIAVWCQFRFLCACDAVVAACKIMDTQIIY